jgi:23S rRNA pseudouridine2605 synthase
LPELFRTQQLQNLCSRIDPEQAAPAAPYPEQAEPRSCAMTDDLRPEANEPEPNEPDTVRPEMAGPAHDAPEADEATEAAAHDTVEQADGETPIVSAHESAQESEGEDAADAREPGPPAKLERLQKILAQAGIASRRHAEELITQGRVQVNGTVVTALGSKADAGRDHIRVDGKLLQGAERLRYFVLNKPKGFVTTVSDPEGRPTVMQFFEKMRERLYPVGRLDYLSEGLLLVTNDGDLANKLTKAASGVEKTYLVKVSGQPTEEELERLREGVAIDRERPGSGQVHTAPAQIRQVRRGDNPWYEVVLIEGRNRELRKMFEEIGHFVEKIRRVGYGPLVLDLEPGKMRELDAEEVEDLNKAAEGKLRPRKPKDTRRAKAMESQLPTVEPKRGRAESGGRGFERGAGAGAREFRPKSRFGEGRPSRPAPGGREGYRPAAGRDNERPARYGKPEFSRGAPSQARPAWKRDDRKPALPAGPAREGRPGSGERGAQGPAGRGRAGGGRAFGAKPAWNMPGGSDRTAYQRPAGPRRDAPSASGPSVPKPPRLQIDAVEPDRPGTERPNAGRPPYRGAGSGRPGGGRAGTERPRYDRSGSDRSGSDRSGSDRPKFDRPRFDRPRSDRPSSDRPSFDRPRFNKPATDRPFADRGRTGTGARGPERPRRAEGGLARPFTTSTGKPRAGGARPSSKPPGRGGRTYGAGGAAARSDSRPGPGRSAGPPSGERAGWKPKPGFGGDKPSAGGRSKPEFRAKPGGGFSKPGGANRKPGGKGSFGRPSGARPGGARPGGGFKSGGSKPAGKRSGKGPGHRSR